MNKRNLKAFCLILALSSAVLAGCARKNPPAQTSAAAQSSVDLNAVLNNLAEDPEISEALSKAAANAATDPALEQALSEAANDPRVQQAVSEADSEAVSEAAAGIPQSAAAVLSEEQALNAALRHAGVKAEDISGLKIKPDYENGRQVFELEFHVGQTEYEYDIDTLTGDILKHEAGLDD